MRTKKRGTASTVPKKESIKYNRLENICLALFYVGLVLVGIGKWKAVDCVMWLGIGMSFSTMIIDLWIMNNEEEEDDDEEF